jgi:hypothetical protein
MDTDPRTLMDLLPQQERSTVANLFYRAVRAGVTDPSHVVEDVYGQLRERQWEMRRQTRDGLSWAIQRSVVQERWMQVLREHREDAVAFARYVIAREQLPRGEREAEKAVRAVQYQQAAMAEQPPTAKQLAYLRSLGWPDGASSKAEASALIDRLRGGG